MKAAIRSDLKTTDQVLAGIDLHGRRAVVTGGSSGLGRETARALAAAGAEVLFTGRDRTRGEEAQRSIREATGNQAVDFAAVDLMSVAETTAFAEATRARFPALDVLILNAATMVPTPERSAEGIEAQFMTSYVAHLIIATTLAPSLVAAAPSRIVALSSSGHKIAPVEIDDINFERRAYDGLLAYGQAKTAAALLAVALNERLAARGVLAFAAHPGVIMETGLARHIGGNHEEQIEKHNVPAAALRNLEQGAATQVWAATAPELALTGGGKYLEDCRVSENELPGDFYAGVMPRALDRDTADQLWHATETMLGRSFSI